jgi:uncharacterized protein
MSTAASTIGTLVPPTENRGDWICTYTCKRFHYLDPRPDEVCIEDIAHALSNLCRFAGHVNSFYSIAQHCVLGSYEVPLDKQLDFLMHDSEEAYTVDMPRPLKYAPGMEKFLEIGEEVYQVIAQKYGLSKEHSSLIKEIDNRMLVTEQRDLRNDKEVLARMLERTGLQPFTWTITPWTPAEAKCKFLARFKELYIGNSN